MERLVGQPIPRVEDRRMVTGRARYVDTGGEPGLLHAAFCRSPVAHARITGLDVSAARAVPGVVAVYTAADLAGVAGNMGLPVGPPGLHRPEFRCLATDTVRVVGDAVAVVIAERRAVALDAVEQVVVDYDPLPAVASVEAAGADGAPVVWPEMGTNVAYESPAFTFGDPDAAFAAADRVVGGTFRQHRVNNAPMETRGVTASYDPGTGRLLYRGAAQSPHRIRIGLAAILGIPASSIDVVNGDIGGSFGQKIPLRQEDIAVCAASRLLGRPVRWIESRTENLTIGGQSRGEHVELEAAVDPDGRVRALRGHHRLDQGAYTVYGSAPSLYGNVVRTMLPAAYAVEHLGFSASVVYSNRASNVAYRGPWAVESFARERLLDHVARDLGLEPLEVRRRNLVPRDALPTKMVTGPTLEGITLHAALDEVERIVDLPGFRARQQADRARGRHRGLGIAVVLEPAPGPPDYGAALGFSLPPERASARLEPDGTVTVVTAQSTHGQGHETTMAQVAADVLGVTLDRIRVVHGDSRLQPFSYLGTGGSRAATAGTGAVLGATRAVAAQVADVAAKLLEANPADIELVDGTARVVGSPTRAVPLGQIGTLAWQMPSMIEPGRPMGIEATFDFASGPGGWAQAVHACVVDVDVETGRVALERYVVVEDCGDVINPGIVDGQIHGGVTQGIGNVLYEDATYDADGTYRASTFADYLVPSACEVPSFELHHVETVRTQEVNSRGVGEGGNIAAPPTVVSAIEDALAPWGVRLTDAWYPPEAILRLVGVLP